MKMASCIVLGHTGAVGKCVLRELMNDARFAQVTVVGRRKIDYQGPNPEKLTQQIVDFEKLEEYRPAFRNCQYAFCSLGTTRADAGSAEKFRRIDHDYVVNSAKLIFEENKSSETESPVHFLYVSAAGTNINSPFLYPKTKGETEKKISETGFAKVTIMRPGLLELEENRSGSRIMETISFALLPMAKWFSPTGLSCPVGTVAKAMVQACFHRGDEGGSTVKIFENKEIYTLAESGHPDQAATSS